MPDAEQERKNRELIEALRKVLETVAERLTPEIEPAVIFVVNKMPNDGQ